MATQQALAATCPKLSPDQLAAWAAAFDAWFPKAQCLTPRRQAALIGQITDESDGLTRLSEDLYYKTPSRIMLIFPHEVRDLGTAERIACNPEALANVVYANRLGNGDEGSGDGWRFRGRGPIMITGREEYTQLAGWAGKSIDEVSDWMETPDGGAASACWFWGNRGNLNFMADRWDLVRITTIVNGPGNVGLTRRICLSEEALQALGGQ